MKILYGIEPSICIENPSFLTDFNQDIVLPKYFYSQLLYLSNGNFAGASEAANKIIISLFQIRNYHLLMFKNHRGGTIYFINETTNHINSEQNHSNIDPRDPLDRYLLRLQQLSSSLEVKIVFLAASVEVTRKCQALNFDITSLEDFHTNNESWLEPEMLINLQADNYNIDETESLVTPDSDSTVNIQWRDIRLPSEVGNIEWRNIR